MANIYIWFARIADRRNFTKQLIELNSKKENNQENKFISEDRQKSLDALDNGIRHYYRLYREYYQGKLPHFPADYQYSPYNPVEVFKNGIRSLYYLHSYRLRPGNWLVLDLRKNENGRAIKHFIEANIPENRLGSNVPIPAKIFAQQKLAKAKQLLGECEEMCGHKKVRLLDTVYRDLLEVLLQFPELFKGDKVYLWEKAAFAYLDERELDKMESCLRKQARLQPGCADAFLNMGSFYQKVGLMGKAIQSYKEGLKINPQDEFIYYNLSALMHYLGDTRAALKNANQVSEYKRKKANYILLGSIYFDEANYRQAIIHYEKALNESQDVGPQMMAKLYYDLIRSYKELGNIDRAEKVLEEAREVFPEAGEFFEEILFN